MASALWPLLCPLIASDYATHTLQRVANFTESPEECEGNVLKDFFTELKKAFRLGGGASAATARSLWLLTKSAQALRLRELCRASLQPTQ
jgi:hypothetical protein